MPITLDPSAAAVIKAFRDAGRPPLDTLSPVEARAASALGRQIVQPEPREMKRVENLSAPSPDGSIPLRLYVSNTAPANPAGLVFYHGGGWTIGDLDGYDVLCRQIADESGLVVISVDYRLAPEHKFPAAVIDAIAATEWIAANAAKLGFDPARMFVGGDSAGGNLAAVVSINARDQGAPKIAGQVLIYPGVDGRMSHPSHRDPETSVLLTHALTRYFYGHYLRSAADVDDWRVSPGHVKDLSRLPQAFVVSARADPLYDEDEEYSQRLRDAGVKVTHRSYAGQFHGFITMGRLIPEANQLVSEISQWLKRSG
jgi:acetyl esterase/lipase